MATLVGTPRLTEGAFSADRTVNLPAGIQADDIIFCVWETANAHTIGSLGDFTQLGTTESSSPDSMTVAYKVATGSEGASITFTGLFAGSESGSSLAFAYRGLDTADLIEAVAQTSLGVAGTSVSGPSITPVNDDCLILQINGADPGAAPVTLTPDAIATSIFNGQDSGNFSYYGVQSYEQSTAGAIALDATFDVSLQYITFQVALNQAVAGPSITPSDPVVDGAEATITASGLSGAITATLGGYSLTTAGTLPNLTYTTDIDSITVNGPVSAPRIGESLTLSVTGDEGTATSTVDFDPAAGYAAVTLAGTLANETDSLIDGMQTASGLTVAVGDIMYYPTADTTSIAATGALTTDSQSFTLILIQGGSATTAGNAYAFTVTPEAVIPVGPQGDWPFSKGIKPSIPVTWTWGARHPLTGMRVRKFNG